MNPPSGAQFEIAAGPHRAVAVEVGGGLREYTCDGAAVLAGYPVERMADGGRGQPLLPWPNRLGDGEYDFDGQHFQLPVDERATGNAIHGLTRWANWTPVDRASDRVRMQLVLHPRPGYPFLLELGIEYALGARGLSVTTTARNIGERRLPYAAGQHPYFTVGTPSVDAAELRFSAGCRLELDARLLPTGTLLPVPGTPYDFGVPRPIGPLVLDACFGDLGRDADGMARVELRDPGGRGVRVWMDASYRYAQLFSGETLSPEHRRRALAIEPMTAPPNAFKTGTDLIVLEPGETHTARWGVET